MRQAHSFCCHPTHRGPSHGHSRFALTRPLSPLPLLFCRGGGGVSRLSWLALSQLGAALCCGGSAGRKPSCLKSESETSRKIRHRSRCTEKTRLSPLSRDASSLLNLKNPLSLDTRHTRSSSRAISSACLSTSNTKSPRNTCGVGGAFAVARLLLLLQSLPSFPNSCTSALRQF